MKRFWPVTLGLAAAFAALAYGASPAVIVENRPPRVTRRSYDARNPPAEMARKLRLPEAGLCEFEFGCEIQTGTATSRDGLREVQATVTSLRFIPRLTITLWTVNEATPKLIAHEEGHRLICEEYYQAANPIAFRLAQSALGKKLMISLRNQEASTQVALDTFQNALLTEFLRETARRCTAAQERFDALTAHGLNPITEADAIRQAVAEEKAAFEGTPVKIPQRGVP